MSDNIPTEPGYYWHRGVDEGCGEAYEWEPCLVTRHDAGLRREGGLVAVLNSGSPISLAELAGEWGPRLSDPEEIRDQKEELDEIGRQNETYATDLAARLAAINPPSIAISLQRIAEALEREPRFFAGIWNNTPNPDMEFSTEKWKERWPPSVTPLTPELARAGMLVPVMDWQQVALNGGPPCFHVETNTPDEAPRFCGRAERWQGHGVETFHYFTSLSDYLTSRSASDVSPVGDTTPNLERAVVREALRQWARDRSTLDDSLLRACDALQRHVGNASIYASPVGDSGDGISPPFSQEQVNDSLQILANLCDRHRRAKLPVPTTSVCEECTKEQGAPPLWGELTQEQVEQLSRGESVELFRPNPGECAKVEIIDGQIRISSVTAPSVEPCATCGFAASEPPHDPKYGSHEFVAATKVGEE